MSTIQILKKGITALETDALVNAANEGLWQGGGVCGVIFDAAGAKELQEACIKIGHCDTGSAVITPGFKLKNKYIIHAVGPTWKDGKHDEPKQLYSAYMQSLLLAKQYGCRSIGFPLISAGIFGYPVDKAWRKAIQACLDFQKDNPDMDMDIQFAVIDDKILDIGKKTLQELKKERTTLYLKQLDDESLCRIREKMMNNTDLLIDLREHPSSGGLFSILCDPGILQVLSTDQLIKAMNALYPEWITEEGWIAKYGDLLLRVIDAVKTPNPNARAQKYERDLRERRIPALKAGSRSGEVQDDLQSLVDVYKTVVCLYRYYSEKEEEFVFEACRDDMEKLNLSIQYVKGTGNQILGKVFIPVKTEERQYGIFLSWILEEFLCEQEEQKASDL